MENKLRKLFDYQKFEENERLDTLIRKAESSWSLSDDELMSVSAAGQFQDERNRPKDKL